MANGYIMWIWNPIDLLWFRVNMIPCILYFESALLSDIEFTPSIELRVYRKQNAQMDAPVKLLLFPHELPKYFQRRISCFGRFEIDNFLLSVFALHLCIAYSIDKIMKSRRLI